LLGSADYKFFEVFSVELVMRNGIVDDIFGSTEEIFHSHLQRVCESVILDLRERSSDIFVIDEIGIG
jgi:hypothetical protein